MGRVTNELLLERQAWPLERKIEESWHRIEQWFNYWRNDGGIYVSFSGGKDSTVLLDLVRTNPFLKGQDIPAVFVDTGLEYPEIREFVKTVNGVVWLKPKLTFKKVLEKYGYPVVGKEISQKIAEIRNTKSDKLRNKRLYGDDRGNGKLSEKWKFLIDAPFKISDRCCDVMKKRPVKAYEKETGRKPIIGTMASESRLRKVTYKKNGCNSFESKRPSSTPMAFWTDDDVWKYIKTKGLSYAKIYDKGHDRTGCMFCMIGVQMSSPNKFQLMKVQHPKQWSYCMDTLGLRKVFESIGIPCE